MSPQRLLGVALMLPSRRLMLLKCYHNVDLDGVALWMSVSAGDGSFDPTVGREDEIHRVIEILCRRRKNNPMLVGEPGVGKTAVAEGLAQRINQKDVPDILLDKVILSLDLASLLAGTKFG